MAKRTLGSSGSLRGELTPCLTLILILALSLTAFAQKGVVHLRVQQTASQSLTLVKPTDPDFESTLDSYFPGLSLEDGYQQAIRPFLVILRNDSGLPAAAYAITWTARYESGWVRPLRNMFVNRPLMLRLAMTYIPPEGVRLISPLFNVTPNEYGSHPNFAQMYPAENYPSSNELASVDPNVDGVVYNDGTFIGADTTHILQRYVMARFADRDEALAALNLITSSTAPQLMVAQQLQETLDQQIQLGGRVSKRTLLARYVRARDRSAQDVQRILSDRGLTGLETALNNFLNRSGGNSNPSSFGRVYQKLSNSDPRVFGGTPRPWLWGLSWTAAQQ